MGLKIGRFEGGYRASAMDTVYGPHKWPTYFEALANVISRVNLGPESQMVEQ